MAGRFPLALVTLKGGVRDRLLVGVLAIAVLVFFSTPLFSSFSMRDVFGVAVTYSLSMISAAGVLLTIFFGGSLVARDIQNRAIYSVATLPISRSRYLLERYLGLALVLCCALALLAVFNVLGLWLMAAKYPPEQAVRWINYLMYVIFDLEKLLILASILVFFSAVATSSFLPIFMTLGTYAIGMTTEKVKYFIETVKGSKDVDPVVKGVTKIAYYIFPNLSAFDLKQQMIYSLPLDFSTLLTTLCYGAGYIILMLTLSCAIFARRDFV